MYYGFTGFCDDFLRKHPGYTIYPIRMNGSAVETVFSQLKYASGGNLMSTNYSSVRSSLLIRGSISGKHKRDDYSHFLFDNIHFRNSQTKSELVQLRTQSNLMIIIILRRYI